MNRWEQLSLDWSSGREDRGGPGAVTLVLERREPETAGAWGETPLPGGGDRPWDLRVPKPLLELRRLGVRGRNGPEFRARSFYRQACFLRDYSDSYPWSGDFACYYPTYRDMSLKQLRGYFTWRTAARRGIYGPIPASAAYVYLYELLNGVGAEGPVGVLEKLLDFERGFLDAGLGNAPMRANLRRWMLEYAVLRELPPALAQQAADPALLERDRSLAALRAPRDRDPEELFAALCALSDKKLDQSPVLAGDPARGRRLFCRAWTLALEGERSQGRERFSRCFGSPRSRPWFPLASAVVWLPGRPRDRVYRLNPCRVYRCQAGSWREEAYEKDGFHLELLRGFLHETEARLRTYLKAGRSLKQRPENAWAAPWIEAAIQEERQALREAARAEIRIDLSGLDRIRREADQTRDSLLVEEDQEATGSGQPATPAAASTARQVVPRLEGASDIGTVTGRLRETPVQSSEFRAQSSVGAALTRRVSSPAPLPLDEALWGILRALLRGEDPSPALAAAHLTPALAADAVNEALLEEFGDTVLDCDGDQLNLVEDYREELARLLEV